MLFLINILTRMIQKNKLLIGKSDLIIQIKSYSKYNYLLLLTMAQDGNTPQHAGNMKRFGIMLFIIQVFLLFMFGFFVRVEKVDGVGGDILNMQFYPMYQDVNTMMLIGFGFLMVGIKNHSWSALAYTFLINAIVVELYLLLQPFWHKVFQGGWEEDFIVIKELNFTGASYSVASILIAFGAMIGRVGPLELLFVSMFGVIGYTLNESLVYEVLQVYDNGGSTAIHTYGAYFGLTITLILSRFVVPKKQPQTTYISTALAMIGTVFLWMFWPSFNAGVFPDSQYERSLVISNTILSLVGSCLGTFIISALFRENNKFQMEDILNASLAGGVIIGAPCGVLNNVGGALAIGFIGGMVSTFCFMKLSGVLKNSMGLYDTCGVHNLHGIPGLLGGILSAIVIAAYQSVDLDQTGMDNLNFYDAIRDGRTYSAQAGIQIAGTFISMGIAIVFGIITSLFLRCFYQFENEHFFEDSIYFALPQTPQKILPEIREQPDSDGQLKRGQKIEFHPSI